MKKIIIAETNPKKTGIQILGALDRGAKVIHLTNGPTENMEQFYEQVAGVIGVSAPMEEDAEGNKTGAVHTHIKYPWPVPSNSYSHSNTRQPFHTDGSYEANAPQISYFFCKEEAKSGGATIFLENAMLINMLAFHSPDLLSDLKSTEVSFSKGDDSKTKPIIDAHDNLTWNWHRCDQQLSITSRFNQFLEEKVFATGSYETVVLKSGESLFFMDEEVLHGRQDFTGPRWLIKGGLYYERCKNRQ